MILLIINLLKYNAMKKTDFFNAVNRAFYFLSNFPYFPDMVKEIAPENAIMQQHYKDKFNLLCTQSKNRSDLALLLFYYDLDPEHRDNFCRCIAQKYGIELQ